MIQSVTFLLTFSRMFQKGVMQNILSILSLLKIVLIMLLSSTPTYNNNTHTYFTQVEFQLTIYESVLKVHMRSKFNVLSIL